MSDSIFHAKLHVLHDAEAVARAGAALIADRIRQGQARVLGLATGRTPIRVYALLVEEFAAGRLSLNGITTFNLDEYMGLPQGHPSSYRTYMERHLFAGSDADRSRTHVPIGHDSDPATAARAYEAMIAAAGGIDLQLLGIGTNGHIGFNEPGSPFDSRTRVVPLAPSTRAANAGDFPEGETPPEEAITMGIGTILEAREILLLASGSAKADAVAAMLQGSIGPACPASALRLHPNVRVICDRDAAAALNTR